MEHRVSVCHFFQTGRQDTGFADLLAQQPVPPAQRLQAWAQRTPATLGLRQALAALPVIEFRRLDLAGLDLFTYGSCLHQMETVTMDSLQGTPAVLASGPVPGLFQSRAELFALVVLFRVARASTGHFRIWSDCLGVVRKTRSLRYSTRPPAAMAPDADLWTDLWESLQDINVSFDLNHVPSHEDLSAHKDLADRWILRGNPFADNAAAEANLERSVSFWQMYDEVCEQTAAAQRAQHTVVRYHCWMARTATRSAQPAPLREPQTFQVHGNHPFRWAADLDVTGRAPHYGAWFTALRGWTRSPRVLMMRSGGSPGYISSRTSSLPLGLDCPCGGRMAGLIPRRDLHKDCIHGVWCLPRAPSLNRFALSPTRPESPYKPRRRVLTVPHFISRSVVCGSLTRRAGFSL